MADSKISALTDGGNLQGTDQVAINRSGTSYRAVALQDGWIDDTTETWTYASGSGGGTATFTIAGVDLTTKYSVGTRIKLTQTTVKYFVVVAVAFSTNTTVTIMAGTDYTLANAAISANYHSYAANPQGYPGWFNFAASATGLTTLTDTYAKFAVVGRACTVVIRQAGTSNSTSKGASLPITPVSADADFASTGIGNWQNNGNPCFGRITVSGSTLTFQIATTISTTPAFSTTGWTNTGSALVNLFTTYQI